MENEGLWGQSAAKQVLSAMFPKEAFQLTDTVARTIMDMKAEYFVSYTFNMKNRANGTHQMTNFFGSMIAEGNYNEASKTDLKNWTEIIKSKESNSGYVAWKVTILFFKKLSG